MKWILIMGFLIAGHTEQAVKPRPKPVDNKQKWLALAPIIKKHYKTDMTTKEIAAELSLQEYYQQKEKDKKWKQFSEEIG